MLYVGCNGCGTIVPLFCAGRFMPHVPLEVVKLPAGFCCPACGIMPPVATCTLCWTQQYLIDPSAAGSTFGSQLPFSAGYAAAPVLSGMPQLSGGDLQGLFSQFARGFASEAGGELANMLFEQWFD